MKKFMACEIEVDMWSRLGSFQKFCKCVSKLCDVHWAFGAYEFGLHLMISKEQTEAEEIYLQR